MAELVDALASGASFRMEVEVRVLSWAPLTTCNMLISKDYYGSIGSVAASFPIFIMLYQQFFDLMTAGVSLKLQLNCIHQIAHSQAKADLKAA